MKGFCAVVLGVGLLAPCTGRAQQANTINWILDVEDGVALAKKTRRPIMFWVMGPSRYRDNHVEREQKRAFAKPEVLRQAGRFVPIKIYRSTHRKAIEQLGISDRSNLEIVFTSPDGQKLDQLSPGGVGNADSFAQKMGMVFNSYRQMLFDKELRPKLSDDKTPADDLNNALKTIEDFTILGADQAVIELLGRERLDPGVAKRCYDVLARLSTAPAVQKLAEVAGGSDPKAAKLAAEALGECTPVAAESLLTHLEGQDAQLRTVVYEAVVKICKIRNKKPERFWEGDNARAQQQEIERVKELVRDEAKHWSEKYEEYR